MSLPKLKGAVCWGDVTDFGLFAPRPHDLFFPFGGGLQAIFRLRARSDGVGAFRRSSRDTTWLTTGESMESESLSEFAGLSTGSIDSEALATSP